MLEPQTLEPQTLEPQTMDPVTQQPLVLVRVSSFVVLLLAAQVQLSAATTSCSSVSLPLSSRFVGGASAT